MKTNAIYIVKKLQAFGYKAVFAGGCVRDMLLNKKPHDYDIATSAKPEEVISLFNRTKSVGQSFGVVLVRLGGVDYEIATFRSDGEYIDGRHPDSIKFSTMEEDAKRRDFTINSIFYDPIKNKYYDFVGGLNDIKTKTLRFVGNPNFRIKEDSLRMLRYVRFIAREGLNYNLSDLNYIKNNSELIRKISNERIREELIKILSTNRSKIGLELLEKTFLLKETLPEIDILKYEEQDPYWHPEGNVFNHILCALDHVENYNYIIKLAVIFHDVGKPKTHKIIDGRITNHSHHSVGSEITEEVLKRLKFSNKEIGHIVWLVHNHMVTPSLLKKSKLKRLLSHEYIEDLIKVMAADKLGSHNNIYEVKFLEQKLQEWEPDEIKPEPLVNGKDLISLGFKPGIIFKEILNKISDLQLEGILNTKDDSITYIKNNWDNITHK
jgi:tRNA nucleotidyltransferase/poly(A) polymerase